MRINFYSKLILVLFTITPHCFSNAIKIIGDENTLRCGAFNMEPDSQNEILIDAAQENKDIILEKHTTAINTILNDYNRVSKRHAELHEKKIILQAVMGSILIHEGDRKYLLKEHDLSENDKLYKHFLILRLTEEFAQTCLTQIHQSDEFDLKAVDKIDVSSYKDLYDYSGLNHALMLGWFKEVYEKHKGGITSKQEHTQNKINTTITVHKLNPIPPQQQTIPSDKFKNIYEEYQALQKRDSEEPALNVDDSPENDNEVDTNSDPFAEIYDNEDGAYIVPTLLMLKKTKLQMHYQYNTAI